jgi:hypothetical protein
MASLIFSESFHMLTSAANRPVIPSIDNLSQLIGMRLERSFKPHQSLEGVFIRHLMQGIEVFSKVVKNLVQQRMIVLEKEKAATEWDGEHETDRRKKDVFSFILEARDPDTGKGMPIPEVLTEASTLIIAGKCYTLLSLVSYVLNFYLHLQ